MIIMIDSLAKLDLQDNIALWAEKKYIEQSETAFANINGMLSCRSFVWFQPRR